MHPGTSFCSPMCSVRYLNSKILSQVVIKVLKPGVEDILQTDLSFLYVAARVLEFLNPQIGRTSLAGIVGDVRLSMLEEVPYKFRPCSFFVDLPLNESCPLELHMPPLGTLPAFCSGVFYIGSFLHGAHPSS